LILSRAAWIFLASFLAMPHKKEKSQMNKPEIDKLESLFRHRYQELCVSAASGDQSVPEQLREIEKLWKRYCKKWEISPLYNDELIEAFNEGLKGRICIWNCDETGRAKARDKYGCDDYKSWPRYLLVPKDFAEKCLILGMP